MFKRPEIQKEVEYLISKYIFEKPSEITLSNGTKIIINN